MNTKLIIITFLLFITNAAFILDTSTYTKIFAQETFSKIVINEIMYNPPSSQGDDDFYEWIELYNNTTDTIDISGWYILDDQDSHTPYTFPAETKIFPNEYIIVAKDPASFSSFYNIPDVYGGHSFNFGNSSDQVRLFESSGELHDIVIYFDNIPWPPEADGSGKSLELINPSLDNNSYLSWKASIEQFGTPGKINSVYSEITTLPAPANVRVTNRTLNSITLNWDIVESANHYIIERRDWPDTAVIASLDSCEEHLFESTGLNSNGQVYLYRVKAVNDTSDGSFSEIVYGITTGETPHLPQFRLLISKANIDSMNTDVTSDIYVPTTFFIGDTIAINARVRYRGQSARFWNKKSWRIKLPSDMLYEGQDEINFNSEYVDESLIRSKLCYDLFNKAGVLSSACEMTYLNLNEDYYGVFARIEPVNNYLLEKWGYPAEGSLYKGASELKRGTAKLNEKKIGDPNDFSDLEHLIEFLHSKLPVEQWRDSALKLIEVEKFFDWYTVNVLVNNMDFPAKNFYLFRPPNGKWIWIPWDYDFSFGRHWNYGYFDFTIHTDDPIDGGSINSPKVDDLYNILLTRLITVPEFVEMYKSKLKMYKDSLFTIDSMFAQIDKNFSSIYEDALKDQMKAVSNDFFSTQDLRLKYFVVSRINFIERTLEKTNGSELYTTQSIRAGSDTTILIDALAHSVIKITGAKCFDSVSVTADPFVSFKGSPTTLKLFNIRIYSSEACSGLKFGLVYNRSDQYFTNVGGSNLYSVYQYFMGNWVKVSGVNHDYLRRTMWVTPLLTESMYLFAIGTALPTDIESNEDEAQPVEFRLFQNYPNPFNPVTTIRYSIPYVETGHAPSVQLKVYDILGREITTLVNEEKPAGTYTVNFSAINLPSGVYLYQLSSGHFTQTKKMILMR